MKALDKISLTLKSHKVGFIFSLLTLVTAAFLIPIGSANADKIYKVDRGSHYGGQLVIPANKSQFLNLHTAVKELSVGNPEIADVVAISDKSLYILGKKIGSTNLTIRDGDGKIATIIDVVVTYDVEGLKSKLYQLSPKDKIEVRPAGQSIVLSGQVSSADKLRNIVEIANQYAPGKVTNMISVYGSQQVLLKVRFAEIRRSVIKDIGLTNLFSFSDGDFGLSLGTGDGLGINSFGAGAVSLLSGDFTLSTTMDLLEQKGFVRTLAEPNIIALSGDNASFLAGGEFPIPVAQDGEGSGATITVEFKEFGVGLSFTPTVVGEDIINLEMDAEVSAIDASVSVNTGTIVVPGLKVRRASTTVELLDGQSFAIAGLIEDNFEDTIRAVPGFGDIPIFGALARSTDYMRNQTELVVIIQSHLVQPTTQQALSVPTDHALPPSEFDLFMLGKIENHSVLNKAAGIDGPYGYILP